jgi:gas vesicle protein
MRKILSWLVGLSTGAAVGALTAAFFTRESSSDIRHRLKKGYAEALQTAHHAQEARRVELEAQLAQMQNRHRYTPDAPDDR